jgi:hypothetical protein
MPYLQTTFRRFIPSIQAGMSAVKRSGQKALPASLLNEFRKKVGRRISAIF